MKKINLLFILGCLLLVVFVMFVIFSGMLVLIVVFFINGGQVNIVVSNIDLNLFIVSGDCIMVINSLDGGLINQEQIDSGGVILVIVSKKLFIFIVEIECGLNFFICVVFCVGLGWIIQLVSELVGIFGLVKVWEELNFYELLLVLLNCVVCQGSVFDEYQFVFVIFEVLQVLVGLCVIVDRVWVGYYLKVVCYSLDNVFLLVCMVCESDFWQFGICVVMFSILVGLLIVGGCMQIWVMMLDEGVKC